MPQVVSLALVGIEGAVGFQATDDVQAQLPDRGVELRGSEPGGHQEPGGLDSLGQGLGQPLEGQLYFGPSRRFKVPGQINPAPKSWADIHYGHIFFHPERSEGSQLIRDTRFFGSLRMTNKAAGRF